jgi:hypothetical protein
MASESLPAGEGVSVNESNDDECVMMMREGMTQRDHGRDAEWSGLFPAAWLEGGGLMMGRIVLGIGFMYGGGGRGVQRPCSVVQHTQDTNDAAAESSAHRLKRNCSPNIGIYQLCLAISCPRGKRTSTKR